MNILKRQIIGILLSFGLLACGNSEGILNGEVFIVTKGGQNIKLGLVTVRVIPETDILAFVHKKKPEALTEIDQMIQIYNKAKQEAKEAELDNDKRYNESTRKIGGGNPELRLLYYEWLKFDHRVKRLAIVKAELNTYKSGKFFLMACLTGFLWPKQMLTESL